jgi:hypothetical protein
MSSPDNSADATPHRDQRQLESLIGHLPSWLQATTRRLRRPSSRWIRVPAGLLLTGGGFLTIFPILGLWMLPLRLMLLSEDVAPLRRARGRVLGWLERRVAHWFTNASQQHDTRPLRPIPLDPCSPPSRQ